MVDDVEFIPDEAPSQRVSERAKDELAMFQTPPAKPNSMKVPLWGKRHISFDPDSSVSVFALLSLVLLLLCVLILALLGIWIQNTEWMGSILLRSGTRSSASSAQLLAHLLGATSPTDLFQLPDSGL